MCGCIGRLEKGAQCQEKAERERAEIEQGGGETKMSWKLQELLFDDTMRKSQKIMSIARIYTSFTQNVIVKVTILHRKIFIS